ncbi:hypothetical protein F5Y01DRAFT_218553 [Xylaria sp. FL0043]|nr:hypothetical protein F5Y01DRAFT_218553 [Xylaria sp. FL0043]
MLAAQATIPPLDAVPERPEMGCFKFRRNRKYGRHDYKRFDHLAPLHASLGSADIGKVNIDCRFLFTKSEWGVMGGKSNQAGIVYLDLTFHEPKGCRLNSATVTVSLDDEHEELKRFRTRVSYIPSRRNSVQMTDCYGPKRFMGPEKSVYKKKAINFNPNVQVAGFGASLVELRNESVSKSSSRWRFSGRLLSSGNSNWKYDALQWELSENDFEHQSTHSDVVHTAFAFYHGGQPFFMKVDIEGKLEGLHRNLSNKLTRFLASTKNDGAAVTLVKFGDQHIFRKPLDFKARNLDLELEEANLHSIPMEVPGPQHVDFHNIAPNEQVSVSPVPKLSHKLPATIFGSSQVETLPTSNEPWDSEENVMAPMLEDLARTIHHNPGPPVARQWPDQIQKFNAEKRTPICTKPMKGAGEENAGVKTRGELVKRGFPHNVIAHVSYLPVLQAFLTVVVMLRDSLSWIIDATSSRTIPSGHEAVTSEPLADRGVSINARITENGG